MDTFAFIRGWLPNICSLRRLWRVLSSQGFQYIKTEKLCQDELENYFRKISEGVRIKGPTKNSCVISGLCDTS